MDIGKEDLFRVNRGFGGNLRSDSSLDFAFDRIKDKRLGMYKKLAYLWRAILIDHPFSDRNRRTAAFVAYAFANKHGKRVDERLMELHIVSISKQNISDIRKIDRRIRNAIK